MNNFLNIFLKNRVSSFKFLIENEKFSILDFNDLIIYWKKRFNIIKSNFKPCALF